MRIALLLSGGVGSRMGGNVPKQYWRVQGRMVVTHCLHTVCAQNGIDAVQIVAAPEWQSVIGKEQEGNIWFHEKFRGFSLPGATRQLSIRSGLTDIAAYAKDDDIVMVHDAVRPLVSGSLIEQCLSALPGHDGVMPVLAMKDTVYESEDGARVSGLLRRERIYAGQAPEFFRFGKYLRANRTLDEETMRSVCGATEPAILAGMDIAMTPGEEGNFKITTRSDWERYKEIMARDVDKSGNTAKP